MKDNKFLKLTLLVITSIVLIILVKQNVTAKKEKPSELNESYSSLTLEINSDLVKQVYNSLIILNDRILDDELYRYSYFNISEDKNELSNEEKLYIAFESLYKKEAFTKEIADGIETLKIDTNLVTEEVLALFRDENFDPLNINYKQSINCGIVDYLYTGQSYELKFKKCESHRGINKSKIESAIKDGNYIKLTIKSFLATQKDENYVIKNYGSDEELKTTTLDDINNNYDRILDDTRIYKYVFSFELKGDNYYLVKIERSK